MNEGKSTLAHGLPATGKFHVQGHCEGVSPSGEICPYDKDTVQGHRYTGYFVPSIRHNLLRSIYALGTIRDINILDDDRGSKSLSLRSWLSQDRDDTAGPGILMHDFFSHGQ